MNWESDDGFGIHILKKIGLNNTDSMVYIILIKFGPDGVVVYDLLKKLQNRIKRTTLYSILKKLIKIGLVEVLDNASTPRNVKKYRAISPKIFFSDFIIKKKKELKELEDISKIFEHELEKIYNSGMNIEISELDEKIQPYIEFLQQKGWKITLYSQEEKVPVFNYSIYECYLEPPSTIIFKDVPFHLFIFDYNIAEDKNALQFVLNGIENQSKELIRIYGNIDDFILKEIIYSYENRVFPAYVIKIQSETIKNHFLLPKLYDYLKLERKEKLPKEIEIGIGVVIPIKNKMFYIWAESKNFIDEIMEIIKTKNY